MTIIGLIGKTNSGKTSTLKHLIIKMLEIAGIKPIYASRHFSEVPIELSENIKSHRHTQTGNVSNISVVLEYKGKIICITSFGDSLKYEILPILNKTIGLFGRCDIFVCGRHENNDLEQEFSMYSPTRFIIIEKYRSKTSDKYEADNKYVA